MAIIFKEVNKKEEEFQKVNQGTVSYTHLTKKIRNRR